METAIITILTTAIGAFIGTMYGSKKLYEFQQSGKIATRKTAIKAIELLKKYVGQPFSNAQHDFNTTLSISEKRAVIVALHKLGVPIIVPASSSFQISDIKFSDSTISNEEMDSIIAQLNKGNCDYLFYEDAENHFSSNLRLNTLRELAKRYVNCVMRHSRYTNDKISDPNNWISYFTPGELQAILVFYFRVHDNMFYEDNGNLKSGIIENLINEIEIGLWDNCLFWDYVAYQNMQNQNMLVNQMSQMFSPGQRNNECSKEKDCLSDNCGKSECTL